MIAVERLAAHPGNVRRDLDLSPGYVESIAVNGVLVALRITRFPVVSCTFGVCVLCSRGPARHG